MDDTNSVGEEKPNFRWSFSQWETYQACPQRWKYQSIMKLPRSPPGPAASRGLEIHASVENYITGSPIETLHSAINKKYIPIFDKLRNHPNGDRHVEKKLAFDPGWFLTGPSSKFAACVAVLDAVRVGGDRQDRHDTDNGTVFIYEWKSGKPKDTHEDQRKLYAMFGMRAWMADRVETTTYYLEDTHPPQRLVLKSLEGFERLKALWEGRIAEMRTNQICAPRPGFHCNWCDFSKKRGGPCQFGS
jgi:hypothetical protein